MSKKKIVVSLLNIQLVQSKFSYLWISNLDPSNVVKLLKLNTKKAKYS